MLYSTMVEQESCAENQGSLQLNSKHLSLSVLLHAFIKSKFQKKLLLQKQTYDDKATPGKNF